MLRLIDAWWHDSQWVDSVSLQCCVWSGNILPPYPNPQPHSKTRLIKVFRVTCWEMPGLSAVNLLLLKLFSGNRQTEWINSCRRPAGWIPAPSHWWLDGGKRSGRSVVHSSLVKKQSRTTNTTTLAGKRYESLDLPTVTRLGVKRRRRGLLTENKQRCTQSISRKPNCRQKTKKLHFYTHTLYRRFPSAVFNRTCVRARSRRTVPSRGAAEWVQPCEKWTCHCAKNQNTPLPSPAAVRFSPPISSGGSIQRVTRYIGGRASPVTRAGWRVFAVHTEHITSSSGTVSSVSSYKSEVLATGGP